MFFKASVLSALVAAASALQVTYPSQGSALDLSKSNTITWSSVSSDPTSFEIVLVNQAVNPSVSKVIASDVETSAGKYTIKALDVTAGSGYQINLVSTTTNNEGILAQSSQFDVTSAGSSSTTSASFSSSTPGTTGTSSTGSASSTTLSTTTTSGSSASSSSASAAASSSTAASSSGSSSTTGSSTGSSTASSSTSSSTSSSSNSGASLHIASGAAGLGMVAMIAALFA